MLGKLKKSAGAFIYILKLGNSLLTRKNGKRKEYIYVENLLYKYSHGLSV
jgi:hypothetical protein